LIAQQAFENRSEASKAESQIKKLPKNLKLGFFA
jgi:putative endonuclease